MIAKIKLKMLIKKLVILLLKIILLKNIKNYKKVLQKITDIFYSNTNNQHHNLKTIHPT